MKVGDLARLKMSEQRLRKWSNNQNIKDHEWARDKAPFLLIKVCGLGPSHWRQWDVLTPGGEIRRIDEYFLTTRGVK